MLRVTVLNSREEPSSNDQSRRGLRIATRQWEKRAKPKCSKESNYTKYDGAMKSRHPRNANIHRPKNTKPELSSITKCAPSRTLQIMRSDERKIDTDSPQNHHRAEGKKKKECNNKKTVGRLNLAQIQPENSSEKRARCRETERGEEIRSSESRWWRRRIPRACCKNSETPAWELDGCTNREQRRWSPWPWPWAWMTMDGWMHTRHGHRYVHGFTCRSICVRYIHLSMPILRVFGVP